MFELRPESPEDHWDVEALYDLCFSPGREALSSYRLRDSVPPVADLCLVARDAGLIAGAIRFWPVSVVQPEAQAHTQTKTQPQTKTQALLLGPVAVHPTHQGEGIGAWLIRDGIDRARACGWQRMLLVGDAPYYGRFGFARLAGVTMPPPTNPDRVLGLALQAGAWDHICGQVTRAACHG